MPISTTVQNCNPGDDRVAGEIERPNKDLSVYFGFLPGFYELGQRNEASIDASWEICFLIQKRSDQRAR